MQYIVILFYGNFILTLLAYLFLFKIRRLIGFQLGMNISMIAGGFLAVVTGVILIYQFPLHFVTVTMVTTVIGMVVGSVFGGLFDYQTILTGFANGLMMGIMAPMVGAAAKNSISFLVLIEIVFLTAFLLVLASARKS